MDAKHTRQAVATYARERLECYDSVMAAPAVVWTDAMRMEVMLYLWKDYDATRPN